MAAWPSRWQWPAKLASLAVAVSTLSPLWADTGTGVQALSAADYFVHSLPGAPPGPLLKMHAGHIEVTPEHNGNLFFWHFENKHIAGRQRTVIWLNGGPGCSSEDGAMMEVGPYRVNADKTLAYNEGAWTEFANVMFVDNPVGTGFSYADTDSYVHELTEMAEQFVVFLDKWFALFPQYEHDDLYLAGESFAGQHIPYIARAIVERNRQPATKHQWQLKGMLIGNGWISPPEQYEAYLDFSYERGIIEKDSPVAKRLENQRRICLKELAIQGDKRPVDTPVCEEILQMILRLTSHNKGKSDDCINMYDVRLRDSYPSCGMNWPPDLVHLTPYLRDPDVVAALHINPNKNTGWSECNGNVGSQFRDKQSPASISFLPELIADVPTLLFSGADDLICNHRGTEAFISNMKWNGGKGFEVTPGTWAPRRTWTMDDETIGFWQEARNLTYVLFHNSSHMVPFDHPKRTRAMLDRFMGVDPALAGGDALDSHVDGDAKEAEPALSTPAANTTSPATPATPDQAQLDEAKWQAYRKSGEVVLVIVAVAAAAWGWYVWRERRRARLAGYRGVAGGPSSSDTRLPMAGESSAARRNKNRDLEAADFDENELDDLHLHTPAHNDEQQQYSVGDSDDESEEEGTTTRK